MSVNVEKRKESVTLLRYYKDLEKEALFKELKTSEKGLSTEEAEEKREEFGRNIITTDNKNTVWSRLREAVINPFNLVLFVISIITFFTDVVYSSKPDYTTVSIILFLIIVSSLVAFVQSQRSNKAAADLSKMISNKAAILRNGDFIEMPIDEIVPGDIVRLSAGDLIPADLRFLFAKDAFVAQGALTGESNPVEKFDHVKEIENEAITDISNIGFMGSNMVSGSARGVVLAINNETYFGSMAKSLSGDRAKNSFERGVDSVSSLLIKLMIFMVPVVFFINLITKKDFPSALLFAISIAVGLTPEMLPVIMTSTLAKGAVTMSKHKVIVKTLGAIQTFGEMDVLCTDKTGTLTEDKIILEKYMDVLGHDDKRVLRHAYLNSYFQTGLKNLMDLAIINRGVENKLDHVLEKYTTVDEIPFDFSRRRMSVVLEDNSGKRQLITKGAVEEMLGISAFIEVEGQVLPLTKEYKELALKTYNKHNSDGLRMIAVAQKNEVPSAGEFGVKDEKEMVLIGFIGFLDPPKESAKSAVLALREHGVRTIVLTGDSEGVAIKVCQKVGIDTTGYLTGREVEDMSEESLKEAVSKCNLFAKLSPKQKERVVKCLQEKDHTVGYMGDGINDAPALHQADVGISVDTAVDIAKETADIILLKKDLMVLEEGVIEGRRTFGNIVKYIKMAASGNFGNMISVIVASIALPFLPMLPVHILTQNLLCDFSQIGIPFDRVDDSYLMKPRKWETKSIRTFMAVMGPVSSIFDILCFAVLWWIIGANTTELAPLFHSGWFVFGTVSQVAIIHMIRTKKTPFVHSRAAAPLMISTAIVSVVAVVIAFSKMAVGLDMMTLPLSFLPWLILLIVGYSIVIQLIKRVYIKKFGGWLS
ncbi:MAG TPA: magnesium-translocating P-type ATPase [Candidatus Dorea intestinavium]|nr:magnesium-translocating P-type ATPase [Candidatus Dorea intestinavium]